MAFSRCSAKQRERRVSTLNNGTNSQAPFYSKQTSTASVFLYAAVAVAGCLVLVLVVDGGCGGVLRWDKNKIYLILDM